MEIKTDSDWKRQNLKVKGFVMESMREKLMMTVSNLDSVMVILRRKENVMHLAKLMGLLMKMERETH